MSQGYISLHRKVTEWEWYQDANTSRLFIHLLLKANHQDNNFRGVIIKRGQLMTGLDKLKSELKISIQSLRTSLKRLEKTKEINIQTTNKYRIITICKYDEYQLQKNTTNKQSNKQLTNKQQATNKQLTANNNVNNENNDNNVNKDNFELFWNYFHQVTGKQKTDKEPALKYWNKLDIESQRKAFKNIKPFFDSIKNKDYCKKARTYLSDKSFNDEFGTNGKTDIPKIQLSFDAQAYLNDEMKQKVLSGELTNKQALLIQFPEQ